MFFSDYPMMRKIDLLLWSMGRKIEKEDGQKNDVDSGRPPPIGCRPKPVEILQKSQSNLIQRLHS